MKHWLSIDPATKTGLALWADDKLMEVATLESASAAERKSMRLAKTALGLYRLRLGLAGRSASYYGTDFLAWSWALRDVSAVVVEEGFGPSAKTVAQHAFRRGFIAALCAARDIPFHVVNVSEWRKVVGAANGFTFPRDSSQAKARAMELVEARFGQRVSDDEADAVCAGLWALQTRTVQP